MTMSHLGRHGLTLIFAFLQSVSLIGCGDQKKKKKKDNGGVSSLSNERLTSVSSPDGVYWGDLHVHSRLSMDSFSFGNRMMTADDAFKFAKGEPVEAHTGDTAQLKKPLDFLLVSDHAEFLGVIASIMDQKHGIEKTELGKRWKSWLDDDDLQSIIQEWVGSADADTSSSDSKPKIE